MGRKSSAKAQARPTVPPPPPTGSGRGFTPILIVALVVVVAGAAVFFNSGSSGPESSLTSAQSPAPADLPSAVALKPHPQQNLPPLPFVPGPPARPMEVVRAVYTFAAEHPEVLSYVPCYCGCERSGHHGNEDCFVTARAENGDVVEWEPHGVT